MKTLIAYGTKYGHATECAEMLKKKLKGDVVLVNLMNERAPDLSGFDTVVVGGSVYMGNTQKQVKTFVQKNESVLVNKRLGFFFSAGTIEGVDDIFKKQFPASVIDKAVAVESFGGVMNKEKLGFFYKKIIEMVEKKEQAEGKPGMRTCYDNIQKMADVLNK